MNHNNNQVDLFRAFSRWRCLLILGVLIIFVSLLFRFFPSLDLATSQLFSDGTGFSLASNDVLRSLRRLSIDATKGLVVGLLLLWSFRVIFPERNEIVSLAKLGFVTSSLLLGPVLITNLILKENWGRPRPSQIVEFGGNDQFVLPWTISDQCPSNCSFVSGETSSAVWLFVLIIFLPIVWQRRALVFVIFYITFISFLRIAFGGHFLSDVLLSILLNLTAFWIAWGVFFRRGEDRIAFDQMNEDRAEDYFSACRQWFQRIFWRISSTLRLPIQRR